MVNICDCFVNSPPNSFIYPIKDSNRLIEEFMLLANISVAEKISAVFPSAALLRCHPSPSEKPLKYFVDYAAKIGLEIDVSSAAAFQTSIESIENDEQRSILQLLASMLFLYRLYLHSKANETCEILLYWRV